MLSFCSSIFIFNWILIDWWKRNRSRSPLKRTSTKPHQQGKYIRVWLLPLCVYSDLWYAQDAINSLVSLPWLSTMGIVRAGCNGGEFNCLDASAFKGSNVLNDFWLLVTQCFLSLTDLIFVCLPCLGGEMNPLKLFCLSLELSMQKSSANNFLYSFWISTYIQATNDMLCLLGRF